MQKILDIFTSYTEAYLEYKNNFITPKKFMEFYRISENDFTRLVHARSMLKGNESWREIDFFYNIFDDLDHITNDYGEHAEYDIQLYHLITRQIWVKNYLQLHGWRTTASMNGQFSLVCE